MPPSTRKKTGQSSKAQTPPESVAPQHNARSWQECSDAYLNARHDGDLLNAQAHLDAAFNINKDPPLKLWMQKADLLTALQDQNKAEETLKSAALTFPKNYWPLFELSVLRLAQNDATSAQQYLDQAKGLAPDQEEERFLVQEIRISLLSKHVEQASEAFQHLLRNAPTSPRIVPLLLQLVQLYDSAASAQPLISAALDVIPEPEGLLLGISHLLLQNLSINEAVSELEKLHDHYTTSVAVGLSLANAYARKGLQDQEDILLAQLAHDHSTNPVFLQHVFATQASKARQEVLVEILKSLQSQADQALLTELHIQVALNTMQYADAKDLIRQTGPFRLKVKDATALAQSLLGLGQFETALRYLEYCMRRWPNATGLLSIYFSWALRLGRSDKAAQIFERAKDTLPEFAINTYHFQLCAMENDLDGAIEYYANLRDGDHLTRNHRHTLARLIFTRADLNQLDEIYARVGKPLAEDNVPLHRNGLPGMMTLELELEVQSLAVEGKYPAPLKWCKSHPSSSMAAIRLIDETHTVWTVSENGPKPDEKQLIPKHVYQYWDAPDPPKPIQDMMASWAQADGFEYTVMDRSAARNFLRAQCGPQWTRAFGMSRNAAEQADFLRLCLLMRFGGVWADADDRLYGDLGSLLDGAQGLVVYREARGGALGNNFIAAPPGHPVLIYAAKQARRALFERSAEISWGKTGPGLLSRAVGQYLAFKASTKDEPQITIRKNADVARVIAMHNPMPYKYGQGHWENNNARENQNTVWPILLEKLSATATPDEREEQGI